MLIESVQNLLAPAVECKCFEVLREKFTNKSNTLYEIRDIRVELFKKISKELIYTYIVVEDQVCGFV